MASDEDPADGKIDSGNANKRPVDGVRKLLTRRTRWLLFGVFVFLAIVALLLAGWPFGNDSNDSDPLSDQNSDATAAWAEIAAELPMDLNRRYSDEELGLHELIDEIVYYRPYYARHRTADDYLDFISERRSVIPTQVSGHERERLQFEFDVEDALSRAYNDLPADLGRGGTLERVYNEWMADCVADAGFPDIVLDPDTQQEMPIYLAEDEELALHDSTTGFTSGEFYDLRLECAQRAASYPTLDPEVRDSLLNRVRKHYLQAVYDFIRDSGIVEIPVEHDESVIHPLEESFIQRCLEREIDERAACAEYHRVELTEEQKSAPVPVREPVDESAPYPLAGQPCPSGTPGFVIVDSEGNVCDLFENLEFVINYPETSESQAHVFNKPYGGERLLICPDHWLIDDENKCRYPHPEHAETRAAFLEEHPEQGARRQLFSSFYPDKD